MARELIKVILPKGVTLDGASLLKANVGELIDSASSDKAEKETKAEKTIAEEIPVIHHEIVHVDATKADEIISDAEAELLIEVVEKTVSEKRSGKLCEINLDTICENFEDGEDVTLAALKGKRLVSSKAGRIKVLARGTMTKKLTIYADKFSIQAVKMIALAGGHAEQYK